jgi:hypothetical protein
MLRRYKLNAIKYFQAKKTIAAYEQDLPSSTPDTTSATDRVSRPHIVYFSCGSHFDYLKVSLKSLSNLALLPGPMVYVIQDRSDPFSEAQQSELRRFALYDMVFHNTHSAMSWGGVSTITNELRTFRHLLEGMEEDAYLFKVDSDIFFLSGELFELANNRKSDLIGQAWSSWFSDFRYAQGGCYAMSARILKRICFCEIGEALVETSKLTKHAIANCPEDTAISLLVSKHGGVISLLPDLMVMDRRLSETGFQDFHIIHFKKDKDGMKSFASSYWDRMI